MLAGLMVPAFFFCFKALNQCCTGLKLSLWGVPLVFSLSFLTAPTANLRTAVLRHKNGKWYAIIMTVEKKTLGLEEDGKINILDVKCDPDLVGMLIQTYGFLPGYHMNKRHWITILLDESVSEAKTLDFLDMSYDLIDSGK